MEEGVPILACGRCPKISVIYRGFIGYYCGAKTLKVMPTSTCSQPADMWRCLVPVHARFASKGARYNR